MALTGVLILTWMVLMTAILQIPYDNHIFPVLCIAVFLCRCGRHVYGNVLAVEDDRQRLWLRRIVIYVLQTVAVEKGILPDSYN